MDILFTLALIGFLTIGVIYFARLIMKKKPYHLQHGISAGILLGLSIVLLAISVTNSDEKSIIELEEKAVKLENVNSDLMSQVEDSQKIEADYELELEEAKGKLAPLQEKLDSNKKEYDSLMDKNKGKDSLIENLEEKVATLEENVESLETELTTAKEAAAVAATSSVSESSTASADTGAGRKFQNCTDLRTVHPGGVSSDHADYQPSMDRDKDGWACE
ncbi:hypothetical protein E2R51_09500 [Jeotgalibacillus sp. S-D1]|uniref:excalibur calcium-binding domain-containing protein n=1 Tax=Jeotgalibacillus sp. S-D1 TaxID=2552189 RepID=UPI001059D2CA|nr:excalibur calcium-binding domain-containing protein [Jeotgalibacillus sp. S-D1]TDL32888.1 hypothetical protein E2R51_09500 [Jeotgalibacillus sp. S-D1]